ncbi:MAG: hypothetical protein PHH13_01090 [Candidatus Peribacteraceae bacterium]|nr:hypothetical protein [Candidatus Peribacteraceae bacterium]
MSSVIEQPAPPSDSQRDRCVHVSVAIQEAMGTLSSPAKGGECVPIGSFVEEYADLLSRESDFREAANSTDIKGREAAIQRLKDRGISETVIRSRLIRERKIFSARMCGTIVLN